MIALNPTVISGRFLVRWICNRQEIMHGDFLHDRTSDRRATRWVSEHINSSIYSLRLLEFNMTLFDYCFTIPLWIMLEWIILMILNLSIWESLSWLCESDYHAYVWKVMMVVCERLWWLCVKDYHDYVRMVMIVMCERLSWLCVNGYYGYVRLILLMILEPISCEIVMLNDP